VPSGSVTTEHSLDHLQAELGLVQLGDGAQAALAVAAGLLGLRPAAAR
jgi:hypothetical protein